MLAEKLLAVASIGGTIVLYVLILLSVISIGVILERWLWFRRRKVDTVKIGRQVLDKLHVGDRDGAFAVLRGVPGVEGEVVTEALAWYDDGPEALEQVLMTSFKERRQQYEAGLNFLGTLGNNAPFIGLFGTVLGVVTAFRELGNTTAGMSNGMGNVMSGIAEALVATAIGILVALPAVIAYNIFTRKVADIEANVTSLGGLILAQMKSTRRSSASTEVVSKIPLSDMARHAEQARA
jgi:biopolymer transport protein ExbB/biopolymer transport protein TolQ